MRLYLRGHDYKYAAEQIMLMMFPEERPEYPQGTPRGENFAVIALSKGKNYTTASVKIAYDGKRENGISRIKNEKLSEKLLTDRYLQRIIKLAFYKAAVKITGAHPAWGALTGIRPGKIATGLIESGESREKAVRQMERDYFVTADRAEMCMDTAVAGLSVKKTLRNRDICLYIGIPFCPTRCAYCSFVSNSIEKSMKLIEPFLNALYLEIKKTGSVIKELGLRVISVYIGGGTPTTLEGVQLERLISELKENIDFDNVREFTVEAGRPDTITEEKLKVLKDGGVTRISVNPQTMSDDVLKAIGRKHTAQDVLDAFEIAKKAGFDIINTDLIAGLPEDSAHGFEKTLDEIIALRPENITIHTLSLKKGTKITLEKTRLPDEHEVSKMLDYASKRLKEESYSPYYLYRQKFISGGFENVGWSFKGTDSVYNICIMEELCSIVALGGGGSTKLVNPIKGKIERRFNAKYPKEYIESIDKILAEKEYIKDFYEKEGL